MPIVVSNLDQNLDVNEDAPRNLNPITLSEASEEIEFTVRLTLSNSAAGVIILNDEADTTHALIGNTDLLNALLATARFMPADNWNGEVSITVAVETSGEPTQTGAIDLTVTAVNDPPTGAVIIHGLPTQGQALTAINTLADPDGMGEVTYQWRANGADIEGADGEAFTLTQDQVVKAITVIASYEDEAGNAEAVTSSPSAVVANVNDAPAGTVSTSGLAQVGRTLTADTSRLTDLDGLGEFSYEWRVDGEFIGDDASLTLMPGMLGKSVTVRIGYEDGYGTEETVTSAGVTVAAAPPTEPVPTVETKTVAGRTITTETIVGPDGIPRQTVTMPPNFTPSAPPVELALLPAMNALFATVPGSFGLTSRGPADFINLQQLLSEINSDIMRAMLEAQQAIQAQNDMMLQNLVFSAGQFQNVPDPITLVGRPTGFDALLIDMTQDMIARLPGPPTIDLSHIDLAYIAGPAKLVGGSGKQLIFGDGAKQSMVLGEGDDELHGGGGADTVGSGSGADALFGDEGGDSVFGGEDGDQLFGGADADTVQGNTGDDLVQGNQGDDLLYGGQGADIVRGGQGDDVAYGDLGNDLVFGDLGADSLQGGAGNDIVQGNQGADTAVGGAGADRIYGGQGADRLEGGDGNDTLSGDLGDDLLTGGAGSDVFLLFAGAGVDRVTDFTFADHVVLARDIGFSVRQEGADTVVDLGVEGRMVLTGVQFGALPEGWLTLA